MLQPGIAILDAHQIMAISTVRPDGWPQTTVVGYANEGWEVYFLIFRSSQKFANIRANDRISFAVSTGVVALNQVQAVYVGGHAAEVTEPRERQHGWALLRARHPNLVDSLLPDPADAALMHVHCKHVSVLDFSKGLGHTETLTVDPGGTVGAHGSKRDDWVSVAAPGSDD